jgi:hypothetical protein
MLNRMAWYQVRDHDGEKREGESDADPEPSRHPFKFRICFLDGSFYRFQGHPTDRAIPWLIAHDIRVHGTCVLRVCDRRAHCFRLQGHSTLRAGARFGLVDVRMHRTDEFCHFAIMLLRLISFGVVPLAGQDAETKPCRLHEPTVAHSSWTNMSSART